LSSGARPCHQFQKPDAISKDRLDLLRKADVVYLDEIRKARIINEVRSINRVVYDITSKPRRRLSGDRSNWLYRQKTRKAVGMCVRP
jgi:hypothetical protein